jgi:serine/threonine-protein kinase RIO1
VLARAITCVHMDERAKRHVSSEKTQLIPVWFPRKYKNYKALEQVGLGGRTPNIYACASGLVESAQVH